MWKKVTFVTEAGRVKEFIMEHGYTAKCPHGCDTTVLSDSHDESCPLASDEEAQLDMGDQIAYKKLRSAQ